MVWGIQVVHAEAVIQKIYRLAYEAQLLAGNLGAIFDSAGYARSTMRANIRGIEFKTVPKNCPNHCNS